MSRMITKGIVECDKCKQYVDYYSCGKVSRNGTTTLYCGYCGKESEVINFSDYVE